MIYCALIYLIKNKNILKHKFLVILNVVYLQAPHNNLYKFKGYIKIQGDDEIKEEERVSSLGIKNLLLRGARLRNTEYICGNFYHCFYQFYQSF